MLLKMKKRNINILDIFVKTKISFYYLYIRMSKNIYHLNSKLGKLKNQLSISDEVSKMNNILISNNILLINYDEKLQPFGAVKATNFRNSGILQYIEDHKPYLIIITTQNSLSRTENHFQHFFGEELAEENFQEECKYKRLSKIDATKPIHSSSMISTFSKFFKSDHDPYNLRTRIYYRIDNVCLLFKDEILNKKSCFTNQKNPLNQYNSNKLNDKKIIRKEDCNESNNIVIENYHMKRYSYKDNIYSKTGHGIITIGLIFKIKDDQTDTHYKLIISNRNDISPSIKEERKLAEIKKEENLAKITEKNIYGTTKSSIYIVSANSINPIINSIKSNSIKRSKKNEFKIIEMNLYFDSKSSRFALYNTITDYNEESFDNKIYEKK